MMAFRHADPRLPFLWEQARQPAGRWNWRRDGPVQYLADTPDGAWAEFLRHEGITRLEELANVRRALWAVEIPEGMPLARPRLKAAALTGGLESYGRCQAEARRLKAAGSGGVAAPSAALLPGAAAGWRVRGGLRRARARSGRVLAIFGAQPGWRGWRAVAAGRPGAELLAWVRPL